MHFKLDTCKNKYTCTCMCIDYCVILASIATILVSIEEEFVICNYLSTLEVEGTNFQVLGQYL